MLIFLPNFKTTTQSCSPAFSSNKPAQATAKFLDFPFLLEEFQKKIMLTSDVGALIYIS